MTQGMTLIEAERERQQAAPADGGEGYGAAHDDQHYVREFVAAAQAYSEAAGADAACPATWPWGAEAWKPRERERNLVRAGALYLAAADAQRRRKRRTTVYEATLRAHAAECAELIDELNAEA